MTIINRNIRLTDKEYTEIKVYILLNEEKCKNRVCFLSLAIKWFSQFRKKQMANERFSGYYAAFSDAKPRTMTINSRTHKKLKEIAVEDSIPEARILHTATLLAVRHNFLTDAMTGPTTR